jgi:hypothetical protein
MGGEMRLRQDCGERSGGVKVTSFRRALVLTGAVYLNPKLVSVSR